MHGPNLSSTVFVQIARDTWLATTQMVTGSVSAVGSSKDDALRQLDQLLVIRRALQFTLEGEQRRQRDAKTPRET